MSVDEAAVAQATRKARARLGVEVICPWHIFWYLRDYRQEWSKEEISRAAEAVLTALISEGAVVGEVDRPILAVRQWPNQDEVVAEVVAQLRALGRDPAPGEIGYLDKPSAAPGPTAKAPQQPSTGEDQCDANIAEGSNNSATPDGPVADAIDELWDELDDDVIGPWELVLALRDAREDWTEDEIQQAAGEVLIGLMSRGAVFGDLAPLASDFVPWPDQSDIVSRLVGQWEALDRDPGVGEIGWICGRETRASTHTTSEPGSSGGPDDPVAPADRARLGSLLADPGADHGGVDLDVTRSRESSEPVDLG